MNFKDLKIPNEYKRLVLKKKLIRFAVFAALFAVIAFVLANWGTVIFKVKEKDVGFRYLFYALALAVPFVVTKIWLIFTDMSYIGVVKEVKIKSVVDSDIHTRNLMWELYRKNETYLFVETSHGEIKRKAFESRKYEENYKVGDVVLHLHGTGVTVILQPKNEEYCQCPVCANKTKTAKGVCECCGYPIMKI